MKTPLVLVSGLLSSDYLWRHQVRCLSEIASIQVALPAQDTPEKMVKGVLEAAPATFALVGHSMGGWLCLEIMRTAPSRVSKLCLINTTARSDSQEKSAKRREMILRAKEGRFEKITEEIADCFVFQSHVRKDVEKMFLECGKNSFIHQEEAMLIREESLSILQTIACPTLVIHAAQDRVFSLEEHEELVAQIPNAKLAIIEDSGHMSPLEMPQAVTALFRFWLSWF